MTPIVAGLDDPEEWAYRLTCSEHGGVHRFYTAPGRVGRDCPRKDCDGKLVKLPSS